MEMTATEDNILQKGINLIEQGYLDDAEVFFAGFLKDSPETAASASTYLAAIALKRDDIDGAFKWGKYARRLAPASADASFGDALAYNALGDTKSALKWCKKTLDLDYNHFECHRLMANILLPGPAYTEILSHLHEFMTPENYVEIGVRFGDSIELVKESTRAIGIDPEPEINRDLKSNIKIFEMTSDDFFASGVLKRELEGRAVELAFIDGMHSFEFALRDFINVESMAQKESVVLIHDCYPLDEITSLGERMTLFWSGDIWKIIVCLKKYRPDLNVNVIKTYPTGLGVVTGLDPDNSLLRENYEKIVSEFEDFEFHYLSRKKDQKLNAVENSWDRVERVIAGRLN